MTRVAIGAVAVALLLAGCFTPRTTPDQTLGPSTTGGQQPVSKAAFLLRLVGLCAEVDNRIAAAGSAAGPEMVADQLEGLLRQALAGQIPDEDRPKFDRMVAALLEAALKQRDVARSTPAASASASTAGASPSPDPAKQAADSAWNEAEAAAQSYGMPRLEDCPKKMKGQAAVWHARGQAPLAVQQAGSAVLDGAVWVVGGITNGAATDRVSIYDPTLDTWIPGPNLPTPLHHPMAVAYRGELVVLGGFLSRGSELNADTSTAVYRLTGGRWEAMPPLLHARAAGAAVVVNDKIVVVGGRLHTQALVEPTEIFDGTRWQEAPPLPVPGDHLAAVTDGTSVYVAGGRALNPARNTAALQQFDPVHEHWTRLRDMPAPHGGLGAVYVSGKIVTAGGEDVASVSGDADVYDLAAGTWTPLPPLPTPRHGLVLAAVGSRIFAIDGATRPNHSGSSAAVEELDLSGAPSPAPSPAPASSAASPSPASSPSPAPRAALGAAGGCPGKRESAVRACLTSATADDGQLTIAFTVNVGLSTIQDAAHRHLHFFLANPDGHGGTVPDASVMQLMAANPGTWFNIYSPKDRVINASTEQGGRPRPLDADLKSFSLLCVRVATGAHTLVTDRSGHLRTGNCVTIARS